MDQDKYLVGRLKEYHEIFFNENVHNSANELSEQGKLIFNELKNIEQKMLKSSEKMELEINKIKTYLNELSNLWQGVDSEQFCQEVYSYTDRLKEISQFFKETSNFVNKANYAYEESDLSFKNQLEKEANENE